VKVDPQVNLLGIFTPSNEDFLDKLERDDFGQNRFGIPESARV
jgi:hypothetical protein